MVMKKKILKIRSWESDLVVPRYERSVIAIFSILKDLCVLYIGEPSWADVCNILAKIR